MGLNAQLSAESNRFSFPCVRCPPLGGVLTHVWCLQTPWEAFKLDIRDLFMDKLSQYPAQSLWRTNSPTHFGGFTGTFTAIEEVRGSYPCRPPPQAPPCTRAATSPDPA